MSLLFHELDYRLTPLGPLSLRRRRELSLGVDIFEIKLGPEYLMSSLFTASERALARLALAALDGGNHDIVVAGLGLGYTARTVLEAPDVLSLVVVEMLEAVIEWHQEALLPLGPELTSDARCRFIQGDFFAMAHSQTSLDPSCKDRRFDAILVDIDHSPDALLNDRSAGFYHAEGLRTLAAHIRPGGIFGLWSNDAPDGSFVRRLGSIFQEAWAEPVSFHNHLLNRRCTQTVYLARTDRMAVTTRRTPKKCVW